MLASRIKSSRQTSRNLRHKLGSSKIKMGFFLAWPEQMLDKKFEALLEFSTRALLTEAGSIFIYLFIITAAYLN